MQWRRRRREFSLEFKREAIALLEASGRPLMHGATEVGISPLMLRNWRTLIRDGAARSRPAPSVSSLPRPTDQESEITRLKRVLDRTRMERDVQKSDRHRRGGAEMSFRFIRDHAGRRPVRPMESFFHTLKVELVHQRRWATREKARRDLFANIEGYYNLLRVHSALGYRTLEQAENRWPKPVSTHSGDHQGCAPQRVRA